METKRARSTALWWRLVALVAVGVQQSASQPDPTIPGVGTAAAPEGAVLFYDFEEDADPALANDFGWNRAVDYAAVNHLAGWSAAFAQMPVPVDRLYTSSTVDPPCGHRAGLLVEGKVLSINTAVLDSTVLPATESFTFSMHFKLVGANDTMLNHYRDLVHFGGGDNGTALTPTQVTGFAVRVKADGDGDGWSRLSVRDARGREHPSRTMLSLDTTVDAQVYHNLVVRYNATGAHTTVLIDGESVLRVDGVPWNLQWGRPAGFILGGSRVGGADAEPEARGGMWAIDDVTLQLGVHHAQLTKCEPPPVNRFIYDKALQDTIALWEDSATVSFDIRMAARPLSRVILTFDVDHLHDVLTVYPTSMTFTVFGATKPQKLLLKPRTDGGINDTVHFEIPVAVWTFDVSYWATPSAMKFPPTIHGMILDVGDNECTETCPTCAHDTCSGASPPQDCNDPTTQRGDWMCICALPSRGNATRAVASCTYDECVDPCGMALPIGCPQRECALALQICEDPDQDPDALGTWQCLCLPPARGSAVQSPATCTLDECIDECPTCEGGVCGRAGQLCKDYNTAAHALKTWVCTCVRPAQGTATGGPAVCVLDECTASCTSCALGACTTTGRDCVDRNRSVESTGDWSCGYDECVHTATPCAAAGQNCFDTDVSADAVHDWVCACPGHATGEPKVTGLTVCVVDECTVICDHCANGTCTAPAMRCEDPDTGLLAVRDWMCFCNAPTVGPPTANGPAPCTLDECTAVCASCANGACPAPEQSCVDVDTAAVQLGTWECVCNAPAVGSAVGRTASCVLDECTAACPTCAGDTCASVPHQQCVDPDKGAEGAALSTWVCVCDAPYDGRATAAPASCALNECLVRCDTCENGVCSAAGAQVCYDPDPTSGSTRDWRCVCAAPSVGAPVIGAAAVCTLVRPSVGITQVPPALIAQSPTHGPPRKDRNHDHQTSPFDPATTEFIATTNKVGAGASLASSGAGAGTAGRLAIIRAINCDVEDIDIGFDTPLDFEFHPFGITFGDGPSRYLIAACLMNPLLIVCFVLLFCGVGSVVKLTDTSGMSWSRALGSVRTPGILYIPYVFVLQGTSLVSARLLFFPHTSGHWALLGGFMLVVCLVSPYLLHSCVLRHIQTHAKTVPDPRLRQPCAIIDNETGIVPYTGLRRTLYRFAFGRTIWVSKHDNQFCEKFGAMFESLKIDKSWVILTELSSILALSCLSVWKPSAMGECNARNFLLSAVCFGYLTVIVRHRPYYAQLDNVIALTLAVLVFVSVFFISMAIALEQTGEGSVWMVVAGFCMRVAPVVVVVKAVWDIMSYVGDIYLARRSSTRRRAREEDVEADSEEKDVAMCELPEVERVESEDAEELPLSPQLVSPLSPAAPCVDGTDGAFDDPTDAFPRMPVVLSTTSMSDAAQSPRHSPKRGRRGRVFTIKVPLSVRTREHDPLGGTLDAPGRQTIMSPRGLRRSASPKSAGNHDTAASVSQMWPLGASTTGAVPRVASVCTVLSDTPRHAPRLGACGAGRLANSAASLLTPRATAPHTPLLAVVEGGGTAASAPAAVPREAAVVSPAASLAPPLLGLLPTGGGEPTGNRSVGGLPCETSPRLFVHIPSGSLHTPPGGSLQLPERAMLSPAVTPRSPREAACDADGDPLDATAPPTPHAGVRAHSSLNVPWALLRAGSTSIESSGAGAAGAGLLTGSPRKQLARRSLTHQRSLFTTRAAPPPLQMAQTEL